MTEQQVRQQGERILKESLAQHRQAQVREVLSQAKSHRSRRDRTCGVYCDHSKWARYKSC